MLTGSEDERVRAAIELLFKKAEEGSNGGRTGGGGWLPLAEACDLLLQNQLALDSRWVESIGTPSVTSIECVLLLQNVFAYLLCVVLLLLENVFSCYRMCSLARVRRPLVLPVYW